MDHLPRCRGPERISRREMLQVGGAGLLGLSLPGLLRAEAEAREGQRRALAEGRRLHRRLPQRRAEPPRHVGHEARRRPPRSAASSSPIATSVPGVLVCEHLPRFARLMHHGTLIRSVHHSVNNAHAAAVYSALTGHDRGDATVAIGTGPNDYPAIGSVVGLCRPPSRRSCRTCRCRTSRPRGAGGPPQPGFFGGWLGRNADPLFVLNDPNAPDFGMPELGLPADVSPDALRGPQAPVGRPGRGADGDRARPTAPGHGRLPGQGVRPAHLARHPAGLPARPRAPEGPRRLRPQHLRPERAAGAPADRGRHARRLHLVGPRRQRHLGHARRTISTSSRPSCCRSSTPPCRACWATWSARAARADARGGHGRVRPHARRSTPQAGRDHWNYCYSLILAGGGIRRGHVHGASDGIGGHPSSNPVTPAEIVATIYQCLGIPADLELRDRLQRPFALVPWGRPIADVLA